MADLEEIMAGRGHAPEQKSEPTQEPPPPRDPPQAPDGLPNPPPGQEPPQQPQDDADPVSGLRKALDEERGKRRKYKDELAGVRQELQSFRSEYAGFMQALQAQQRPQQPPPPPPDFWENPDAALDHRLRGAVAPVQQGLADTREQFSRMMAADKHGEEVVNTAYAELEQQMRSNPQAVFHDYQRIMQSPHPFGALVQWHNDRTTLREVGPSTAAFREKMRAELMAELQAQQQPPPPPPGGVPQQAMPSNFAGARSAGTRTLPQTSGPLSLSEIYKR